MPKINRPFVPQQPGAGTDNYIDGGPTRAGLEELRGKVNAAPTTWATVAEAEAASYTEPESVVITETGRTYTYSASSEATRDGIRVLTPAGGGRLLATKTGSDDVEVPKIGTPDHQSLTQSLQVGLSAGACNGNFVTDAGGGTINIASGEGMIRATNSSDSEIFAFRWAAVNGVAIPLNSVRYVGVEYNSGNPQAIVRTTNNWNGQTEFQAATVVNEGGTLHILNNPQETCDGVQKIFHRLIETQPFQFAERLGGGRFSEVGTRNLSLSPCEFYDGLNEFPVTAKNTSTGDTFDAYYGNFTKIAAQTQWDNQNYDNAGTLTALSANRYGVHWLYIEMDDSFALVYGQGNYNTISDAEAALPPASLPLRLSLGSRLAAKLIFQKGAASAIQIESAFDVNFQSGMPVLHSDLSNILGNGTYHLSESERDAAIRTATASQSGLMSAAQAQVVSAITADGTGNVGIGQTTPTAKTHIKGKGSTSATTAFKVDNSSNTELFKVSDDGQINVGGKLNLGSNEINITGGDGISNAFSTRGIIRPTANNGIGSLVLAPSVLGTGATSHLILQSSSNVDLVGSQYFGFGGGFSGAVAGEWNFGAVVYSSPNTVAHPLNFIVGGADGRLSRFRLTGTYANLKQDTGIGLTNTSTTPSARLHIKGSTSDNTAYGLKVNDSSNAKNFYVRNDGQVDSSGSRVIGYEEFTSDSTLTQSSKSSIICIPSGAGMVLTMHLSPPGGILQTIVNASAFAVTLGRNSQKIASIESNYTLPANTSITLQFFGSTLGWLIISQG